MNHKSLVLACAIVSSLALAGCKPQPPAETAAPVVAEPPAPAAPPAAPVAAASAMSAPALDQKGFAGTFAGGGSTVTLVADGTFSLKNADAAFDGSWTAEADGARIRLDPNSKAEPDRLFAVGSQDEIHPLDAGGQPVEGSIGLQRDASGD